jgi:hypothetical protein
MRLTERHFPTRISPQRRNINQQDSVWSSASMIEEEILYVIVRLDCDVAVCVDGFSRAYN